MEKHCCRNAYVALHVIVLTTFSA